MKKIIIIALVFLNLSSTAKEIYVDAMRGSDINNGTKEAPVATLRAARDMIRHYKSISKNPQELFIANVLPGIYEQVESLVFNELDGGSSANPVVWRAVESGSVRIIGGKSIPGASFVRVKDSKIIARLPKVAREKVLQVDLKSLGVTNYGSEHQFGHALPVPVAPLELFFNNNAMTLARYPNEGYMKIGKVADAGSVPRTGDYSERGGEFEFTDDRHLRWIGLDDVWFQGTFNYGFADDNLDVEKIDPKSRSVKMKRPHLYGIGGGKPYQQYFAKNILEELDSPSEWYLDKKSGILYFWPAQPIDQKSDIIVSIIEEPIISLEGVSELKLEGFTVEAGRGIGIYMELCAYVTVAGCTVRNVGNSGVFMGQGARQLTPYITHDHYDGVPMSRFVGNVQGHIYKYTHWDRNAGHNNKILSCDVYNTGSGGIYLSGGSKAQLIPGNNIVENCKISNYNRRNKFLWAGINVDGCGNKISHNEVFDSEWQGIYVHGNEHVFEYNEIHHVTTNSNDTSPWYIGRDPSDRGNVVRYNYIHNCGNPDRMTMGIYCDDSSTDVSVYGNVFYKMNTNHGVMFSNTGWDLRFENNIVIDPIASTVFISNHYYTWAAGEGRAGFNSENGYLYRRMTQNVNVYTEPYASRYPELVDYLSVIVEDKEWEGMRPRRNAGVGNLIVRSKVEPLRLEGKYAQCEWINNYSTQNDPGFVDMEGENFNLKTDSEVFDKIKGFKTLPFDKMGLYVDKYRTVKK